MNGFVRIICQIFRKTWKLAHFLQQQKRMGKGEQNVIKQIHCFFV